MGRKLAMLVEGVLLAAALALALLWAIAGMREVYVPGPIGFMPCRPAC